MSAGTIEALLGELGRGDEIAVAERLKGAAWELGEVLDDLPGDDGTLTTERVTEILAVTDGPAEVFLSLAFPIAEYGKEVALDTLLRALRHITCRTALAHATQTNRRIASVPTIGRLVWAITAFSLHCDRPTALAALARASVVVPYSDDSFSRVIALRDLRYPQVFGSRAGNGFNDYHDWLLERKTLERCPLFRAEFDAAFLEADLVLAMCAGATHGRAYAVGRERATVGRLADRARDAQQRPAFEQLFPGDGDLHVRLEMAYATTESSHYGFDSPPDRLFGAEPDEI